MADFGFTIQELQAVQITSYVSAAAGALVVYDKVLTFSHEIDHVWGRQWNFTTALYLIARYSGDLQVIAIAAWKMCIDWTTSGYMKIYLIANWGQTIFILTMQAILVIRVYALLNRSKKVLVFLTISYALQTIATFVMSGLLSNKQALHEYVSPAIDSVTQNVNTNDPSGFWPCIRAMIVLPVAFDTILLFFALWAFIGHALEAKKLHGGWSINVLVRTLMADHLVHFFCNLTWLSLNLSVTYTSEFNGFSALFSGGFNIFTALVVAFGPRMVISLRATENKTRRGGVILGGNLSTIQSGVRAAYPVREGYGDRRQVPSD